MQHNRPNLHTKHRIMVIDDSITVRKIVAKSLDVTDISVVECCDGKSAMAELSENFYDLIFLDYILPDLTAAEFLNNLVTNTNYARLPIVLMSSKSAEIKRLSKFQDNVICTLTKPFTQQAVLDAIQTALKLPSLTGAQTEHSPATSAISNVDHAKSLGNDNCISLIPTLKKSLLRIAGHIPSLEKKRGDADPKQFYQPYLLHPELIKSVETQLSHLYTIAKKSKRPTRTGTCEKLGLYNTLYELTNNKSSGRLQVRSDTISIELHLYKGSVLGITCKDTENYLSAMESSCSIHNEEKLEEAKEQHTSYRTPIEITLRGHHSSPELLCEELTNSALNLLSKAIQKQEQYVFWQDEIAPEWAANHSIAIPLIDAVAHALRKVKGWQIINQELGELSTLYEHTFANKPLWILSHLNSFESVVYDYFRFGYTISELASTLGESPTRVAEASYLLFKFGLIKSAQPKSGTDEIDTFKCELSVIVVSTTPDLIQSAMNFFQDEEIQLFVCDDTKSGLLLANRNGVDLLITDGITADNQSLDIVYKLQQTYPNLSWIYADSERKATNLSEVIRLSPIDTLECPFSLVSTTRIFQRTLEEVKVQKLQRSDYQHNYFETLNTRLIAQQRRLAQNESDLQQRENELLRNEEIFFHKCNVFEEERARLDIMNDQYAQL